MVLMRGVEPLSPIEMFLKQELQCFVDSLLSHVVNTIIKPGCERMLEKMSRASDIDQMTAVHDAFIYTIQTQCLLTKNLAPISQAIISLLDHGARFADLRRQMSGRSNSSSELSKAQKRIKSRGRSSVRLNRNRRGETSLSSDEEPEDNDEDPDYDADTEKLSGNEGSYEEKLGRTKEEVTRLRTFIVTGLRGISRAGGEPTWEMLAEQLDWGNFGRT
jgi:gamma-tubulin complex component 5